MCGTMGYKPHDVWYRMTLRQCQNIAVGYQDRVKDEHETRVLESRVLLMYYAEMKSEKSKKTFKEIYPISIDEVEEKNNKLPKNLFAPMLVDFFKALSNER